MRSMTLCSVEAALAKEIAQHRRGLVQKAMSLLFCLETGFLSGLGAAADALPQKGCGLVNHF